MNSSLIEDLPNHEEIEREVLNLEDPPETIDRKFVERVKRYTQVKGVPSEGTSSLVLKRSWGSNKAETP